MRRGSRRFTKASGAGERRFVGSRPPPTPKSATPAALTMSTLEHTSHTQRVGFGTKRAIQTRQSPRNGHNVWYVCSCVRRHWDEAHEIGRTGGGAGRAGRAELAGRSWRARGGAGRAAGAGGVELAGWSWRGGVCSGGWRWRGRTSRRCLARGKRRHGEDSRGRGQGAADGDGARAVGEGALSWALLVAVGEGVLAGVDVATVGDEVALRVAVEVGLGVEVEV